MSTRAQNYTWNKYRFLKKIELEDDSLRDGIQGSLMYQPDLGEKLQILEEICYVGIEHVVLGFPASSPTESDHVVEMAKYLKDRFPQVQSWALCRVNFQEAQELVQANRVNKVDVGASLFISLNKGRLEIEDWDFSIKLREIEEILSFFSKEKVKVCFNIEDATRTSPEELEKILAILCKYPIYSIAICDTVGAASPAGAFELIAFVKNQIQKCGKNIPKILWHGHNDRGLALANALSAIEAGADIISGTFFGMGERAGNTALEHVAFILNEENLTQYKLEKLQNFAKVLERHTGFQVSNTWPLVGSQVFSTSAGIHASAILKGSDGGFSLNYLPYGDIDPQQFNRETEIRIGSTSGKETLKFLLKKLNIELSDAEFLELYQKCKKLRKALTAEEFKEFILS